MFWVDVTRKCGHIERLEIENRSLDRSWEGKKQKSFNQALHEYLVEEEMKSCSKCFTPPAPEQKQPSPMLILLGVVILFCLISWSLRIVESLYLGTQKPVSFKQFLEERNAKPRRPDAPKGPADPGQSKGKATGGGVKEEQHRPGLTDC